VTLKDIFLKVLRRAHSDAHGTGVALFEQTGDVIRAEQLLKDAGIPVAVKAPPSHMRKGCDLAIEYRLEQEPFLRGIFDANNLRPLGFFPVTEDLPGPASLFAHKDFGEYMMVRAANMKITIEKVSGRIVNVSGGGCPDVPHLARILVNQTLGEAEPPRKKGQSLCAYALHLAFEEAKRLWNG
jgi:hypothetical protein